MALALATVRGALWTIATGVGSRGVGLVGTLVLTRFIAPDAYGEVMVASVVVQTANQITAIGFGQYLVANPDAPRSALVLAQADCRDLMVQLRGAVRSHA